MHIAYSEVKKREISHNLEEKENFLGNLTSSVSLELRGLSSDLLFFSLIFGKIPLGK